ncbi:MAG TPA: pirin family protein [Nitrospiria bacterium]|nr:pirin family protein [Nitrospiria bacterium]
MTTILHGNSLNQPIVDVRRDRERFHTRAGWLDSYHSFSFSHHYDPANTHHGLLRVSNDDVIKAGTGFSTHPHQDMEIVTWVLDGELEHKDSVGNKGIIYPGLAQRMSAGTGIWHSEMNPRGDRDVRLVQMWVLPDTESADPGYEQLDINSQLKQGGLVPIASGRGHQAAISIRQRGAVLWGGRLRPGESARIPESRFVHLYVAKGAVELEEAGSLAAGDAVRLTAAGARRMTADPTTGAEVLLWEME